MKHTDNQLIPLKRNNIVDCRNNMLRNIKIDSDFAMLNEQFHENNL